MKNVLLAIIVLSAPCFGQYSSTVLTNSPGDYAHMVPYATVKLCQVSDSAVPCTTQIQTFTDYTLATQCTLIANAGQTPGPASGTGCNNPGLTDVNGNYTLFAASGTYTLCSYYTSWYCAKIVIGGAGASSLPCPTTVVNGAIGYSDGAGGFNCDPFFTTNGAGDWIAQSGQTVGAFNGMLSVIGGGTSPGTAAKYKLSANEFRLLGTDACNAVLPQPSADGSHRRADDWGTDANDRRQRRYGGTDAVAEHCNRGASQWRRYYCTDADQLH